MPPFLLAATSLAHLMAMSLHFSNNSIDQPSAIGNAIFQLVTMLENGDFQKPGSVEAVLKDLLDATNVLKGVLPAPVTSRLDSISTFLDKSVASVENLKSGQVAEEARVTMSFDGKEVPVDVFAVREDANNEVTRDLGISESP